MTYRNTVLALRDEAIAAADHLDAFAAVLVAMAAREPEARDVRALQDEALAFADHLRALAVDLDAVRSVIIKRVTEPDR